MSGFERNFKDHWALNHNYAEETRPVDKPNGRKMGGI